MKRITILFLFIFSLSQSQDLTLSGGTLTIERTGSLTMTGNFANNSGTVTLNSDANEFAVIKVGGSASGNITYNRWVNAIPASEGAAGWDLLGAPMTNGTLTASNLASTTISGTTYYAIQPYDNTDNTWNPTSAAGTYTTATGTGYAMAKATAGTVGFTGVPSQKTNVSKALTENKSGGGSGDRWNLIANPFPAYLALNAAANPANSKFYYYVSNGKGGHYFSMNLEEHNKNVKLYKSQINKSN